MEKTDLRNVMSLVGSRSKLTTSLSSLLIRVCVWQSHLASGVRQEGRVEQKTTRSWQLLLGFVIMRSGEARFFPLKKSARTAFFIKLPD